MRAISPVTLILIAMLTCEAAWASETCISSVDVVDYAQEIQPIFDANCVSCHQTASPSGQLSLQRRSVAESLVNAQSTESGLLRVNPGNPDLSYLVHKLRGTYGTVGGSGQRMPVGGALSEEQIALIENWIAACAPLE